MPYTQATHDALIAAQAVARPADHLIAGGSDQNETNRHPAATVAHLMLGLLAESGGTGTRALTDQGLRLGVARTRMAELTLVPAAPAPSAPDPSAGAGPSAAAGPQGRHTELPTIDTALQRARIMATALGHPAVGTGHLLLVLTHADALGDHLAAFGLDADAARRFVLDTYAADPPRPRDTGEEFD